MDELSQAELERILKKSPFLLTLTEIAFLRARRDYLTPENKRVFAMHLDEVEEQMGDEKANPDEFQPQSEEIEELAPAEEKSQEPQPEVKKKNKKK